MLIKGKRTFESLMNSIALHLSMGDWDTEEGVEEASIVFGDGEWSAILVFDPKGENIHGLELENSTYTAQELMVVEKAISLLEGIKWSEEAAADIKKPRTRRAVRNGHSSEAGDEDGNSEE